VSVGISSFYILKRHSNHGINLCRSERPSVPFPKGNLTRKYKAPRLWVSHDGQNWLVDSPNNLPFRIRAMPVAKAAGGARRRSESTAVVKIAAGAGIFRRRQANLVGVKKSVQN